MAGTEEAPDRGPAWDTRGHVLRDLERWLEAVTSFGMALELGGTDAEFDEDIRNELEHVQRRLDRQSTKAVVQHILDLKDDGTSEFKRKEYAKALDYYDQGAELVNYIV